MYLLAFAPDSSASPGAFRKLKVEVTGIKNVSVQARRGYFTSQPHRTREVRDLIRTTMMSPNDVHDISLTVDAEFQQAEPHSTLRVNARISAGGLTFRKCQDHLCNTLTVVYGLFDTDGGYVGEITRKADLRLNAVAMEKFQKQGIQLGADFKVPQRAYSARVVVIDEEARKIGAIVRPISAPAE